MENADKVANLRDVLDDLAAHGEPSLHPFRGGRSGTVWYYQRVVGILAPRVPALAGHASGLLAELEAVTSGLPRAVISDVPGRDRMVAA